MVSCYNTVGRENRWDNEEHAPCNATALELGGHSTCCRIGDSCLTNGMCLHKEDVGKKNWYWRTGCTDKDWKDPACPKYCENIEPTRNTGLVFQCAEKDSWCCGYVGGSLGDWPKQDPVNRTCCSIDNLKFTADDPVEYAKAALYIGTTSLGPSSTQLSTISQPTPGATQTGTEGLSDLPTSTTTPAPSSAPSQEASSSGLSTGAKVGLGVGIPVGVLAFAAIGAFFWMRRRKQSAGTKDVSELHAPPADDKAAVPPYQETAMNHQGAAVYRHEAPSPRVVAELPGSGEPHELPQQTKLGQ